MKKRNRATTILSTMMAFLFITASSSMAEVYYLIVGVADYKYVSDLLYSDNDATDLYNVLYGHLGKKAAKKNAKLLVDKKAKKSSIKSQIKRFTKKVDPGDTFVFFFAGHGSYSNIDFPPLDEPDGGDEFICPWDSDPATFDKDIRDDELDEWLTPIVEKGGNVVVILDTCYSGGAIRAKVVEKGVEREVLVRTKPGLPKRKATDSFIRDLDKPGFVVMTAVDDDELSYEDPWIQNGVFTQFVLDSFAGAADDGTVNAAGNLNGIITVNELWTGIQALNTAGHFGWITSFWGFNPQVSGLPGDSGDTELVTMQGFVAP